jgi:hypothetical protein
MKPSGKVAVSPVSVLVVFLLLSISCRQNVIDEVKVPDFVTLSSQFNDPPAEYTTSPFFVWNGDITNDEIDKFLTGFKEAGSSQVFIHPRPGLITEYLSDKWFDLFRYAVERGRELGIKIWIYDENSYPSGFAGGHVPAEMPESWNQGQGLKMTKFEVLPDTCEKYLICLKEGNGTFKDITSSLPAEKGKSGNYYLFSKTFNGRSDWYGGFSYVDLLYPGVTQKFIQLTMTGYEKYLGQEFGKTIPGTFTDEPQINSPGGIRWTPDLFDQFSKQWNYDLKDHLPSLFEEVGEWKKIRHNYTRTLLSLFIDRWAKPWYRWCGEKGLKFTGHYWEHEWPNMRPGGDNMAMYAWHHVPGIDMLFNQWDDSTARAQFGNIRSVKELASAANQTGHQRKLSETYGGSGWDLTFTDMKRNGDWEYALGVNLMNQHLTYFTMAGARKYDYPPTFDYHEPWWKNYRYINTHFARLSLALSSGRQVNDILIIEPTTTSWLYDSYAYRSKKTPEIGQSFQTFITKLEKSQVEYDLGSENIIRDLGKVVNGKLVVGQTAYSRVIIPPMTENLDRSTFNLLKTFVSGGGTLIAFSTPSLVDGSPAAELKKFFTSNSGKIVTPDQLNSEIIKRYFSNVNLRFETAPGGALYHHRRILTDGQILFLANSSLTGQATGSLKINGADAAEMNTLTGKISGYANKSAGNEISLAYSIPPAGSLLLFIPGKKTVTYPVQAETKNLTAITSSSPIKVTRNEDNALMIDFCDISIGGEVIKNIHTMNAADRIYKYYGFRNGNPWNTSVQFKTNIVDRDTFGINTGFTAAYHFKIKGQFDLSHIKAVVERASLWTISVNGKEVKSDPGNWWLDRSFGVVSIGSLLKRGDNTIILKVSPMKIHAEAEPVYIIGDFSVTPADQGFIIEPPLKSYQPGSWKMQGLPFYSWNMTYCKEFNIENPGGKWEVGPGSWKGTVAEVKVNGKAADLIAFPPFRSDITGLINKGTNRIEITVTGSLRNLMGPHHNNPGQGLASPGSWRNVKNYMAGKEYLFLDYGLMDDIVLYRAVITGR